MSGQFSRGWVIIALAAIIAGIAAAEVGSTFLAAVLLLLAIGAVAGAAGLPSSSSHFGSFA